MKDKVLMVSFIYKANLPWIIQFQEQGTKKKRNCNKKNVSKKTHLKQKKTTLQLKLEG